MAPDADAGKSSRRADPFAPLTSEQFVVGDGHDIYLESVGRTGGIPAVYLHGGPGSGCQPDHRRLFDPERVHAVLFDQRVAGLSRPKGRREHNTLPHLIADMEMIREKFGFEQWMVVGGSWGATEQILSEHAPNRSRLDVTALTSSRGMPSTPFMEAHYFANECFMRPNQLMEEAGKLTGIPGIIVQGRYDLLCPPKTSHALAKVWREAEIRVVEGAGHTLYDPGVRDAVMRAIADIASRIG